MNKISNCQKTSKLMHISSNQRTWFIYKTYAMFILIFAIVTYSYFPKNWTAERYGKLLYMERSILSPLNRGACYRPYLPINNPEIMKLYKRVGSIDCSNNPRDWVSCEQSICHVKPEIHAAYGQVTCFYTDILHISDTEVKHGPTVETQENYVLHKSDFIHVACKSANKTMWKGLVYGIQQGFPTVPNAIKGRTSHFNVLMLGFDSMSRNAFMRKLPKSYDYLTTILGSIVLNGYNVVDDGTPQSLTPIITGYTELELPEKRRNLNATDDDLYTTIWQDYAHEGYYTAFNEDLPQSGTFSYRLMGFKKQPTIHYMRTLYTAMRQFYYEKVKHCIGHRPDHVVMLDYTMNFMKKYRDVPHFAFSFHGGLSHNSINLIGAADDDVLSWLTTLKEAHLLDDTILIMMSDHGNRFAKVRATLQGKLEERLPFFSFAFPHSFKKLLPLQYENFVRNSKHLTTPFDIHATLKDILRLQNSLIPSYEHTPVEGNIKITKWARKRAISLFDIIPVERSCADAYIEPHWCACHDWRQITINNTQLRDLMHRLSTNIVEVINNATIAYREFCEPFHMQHIDKVSKLEPKNELINFKQNGDKDGATHAAEEIYQLQIVVNPRKAVFQANVHMIVNRSLIYTKLSSISRINAFKARCMNKRERKLRKYCHCRPE